MSPKTLNSRHSIDSCTFQLHNWKPFISNLNSTNSKTLIDSDSYASSNPNPNPTTTSGIYSKRPCLSDRTTSFSLSIDSIDFSKLSLFDDKREKYRWMSRKRRRRRGSRSVSGRSCSERNGRCCGCSVGATATCSDVMVAAGGTDSSGELFLNGDVNWGSDVSEVRREKGVGERENLGSGFGFDAQGSESGYGSEPGYRGDAEFGYGDEADDEEEDGRLVLWGERMGVEEAGDTKMEMVGENTFTEHKSHHRGRRKKHDWRVLCPLR